ncbi:MAG: FMN-binding protein [Candidatus Riflebacteria bacterium]|nr:FMN-binding protein [Candidatus Riflebacteria bacterium]
MKKNIFPAITILLIVAVFFGKSTPEEKKATVSLAIEKKISRLLPDGLSLRASSDPEIAAEGINKDGSCLWKAYISNIVAPEITGYSGPIELLVGIDDSGGITGVEILSHSETKTFVEGIEDEWFLKQFNGKTLKAPIVPFKDIDGITHATVSVNAICNGVHACLEHAAQTSQTPRAATSEETLQSTSLSQPQKFPHPSKLSSQTAVSSAPQPLQQTSRALTTSTQPSQLVQPTSIQQTQTAQAESSTSNDWLTGFFKKTNLLKLPTWGALAICLLVYLFYSRIPRLISFFLNAFLLGFFCHMFISLHHIKSLIFHPGFVFSLPLEWQFFFLIVFILVLFYPGRYCERVCPMGNLQLLLYKIAEKIRRNNAENETRPVTIKLGRALLYLSFLLLFIDPIFPVEFLEIFSRVFIGILSYWGLIFVLAVAIGSFFIKRFYCLVFCPINPFLLDLGALRRLVFKNGSK